MFKKVQPNKRRIILATLLSTGLLLVSTVVVLRLSLYGAHFTSFIGGRLATILGMPVEIQSTAVDFPILKLRQVTIGEGRNGVIDVITVRIGLSPFSGSFLAPQNVQIGNVTLQVPKATASAILGRLMGGASANSSAKSTNKTPMSLKFLPEKTEIDSVHLSFRQDAETDTFAIDHLNCLRTNESINCQAKYLKSSSDWQENDVSMTFSEAANGQWLVKGSGRSGTTSMEEAAEQAPAWNGEFSVEADKGATVARFQTRGLPTFLQRAIESHLGAQPSATVRGQLRAKPLEGGNLAYSLSVETDHLDFSSTAISKGPIGPFPALLRAKGRWFPSQGALTVEDGAIVVSSKRLDEFQNDKEQEGPEMSPSRKWEGKGTLRAFFNARGEWGTKEQPRPTSEWSLFLRVPPTPCSDLVSFAPEIMWPPLKNLVLAGSTQLEAEVQIRGNSPQDFLLKIIAARYDCKISRFPTELSASTLLGPLNVRRAPKRGAERFVEIGPNSTAFTAYEQIPNVLRTAILSAEDAGFFAHHGIDFPQMEAALRRNLVEGRIHVGASTITMQTVKNLFLSNERTLVRKLQELLLAWTLEKQIPKHRILEIYLNLAEFGPDIYGVGEAAKHFFNKAPGELNLVEAVYLSTLLPSPTDRYLSFCRGEVSPGHRELVNTFLQRLNELGRISPTEYNQAFATPVRFSSAFRDTEKVCRARMGSVVVSTSK